MATLSKPDSLVLCGDRLRVEIVRPGTIYRGTRFDWSGFITQVTWEDAKGGKHTFCAGEAVGDIPSTGGIGLCNEFGNEMAVGYADARPGESFPKLGIGLLVRPEDADYSYMRDYEIAQPFPIQVEMADDHARFVVEPLDCRGYAARLVKTVAVHDSTLTIDYRLENTGHRPISTHEYCHNFMCIDDHSIGPDYRLRFPYTPRLEPPPAGLYKFAPPAMRKFLPRFLVQKLVERMLSRMQQALVFDGQEISWGATPGDAFYGRLQGFFQTERAQWELIHLPSGIGLGELDDFTPSRVAVWGRAHVVSAEVFVDIHLQPGEAQAWSRRYEFFETLSA